MEKHFLLIFNNKKQNIYSRDIFQNYSSRTGDWKMLDSKQSFDIFVPFLHNFSKSRKQRDRKGKRSRRRYQSARIVDMQSRGSNSNPPSLFTSSAIFTSTFSNARIVFLFKMEIKKKNETSRWSELERGLERAFDFRLEG